jgi:hypothetical protein
MRGLGGAVPGSSLLLALTLSFQAAPPPESSDRLRELVASSEVIAWVRVAGLREFASSGADGVATFLELRVEELVFGPGDPPVVLAGAGTEPLPAFEAGERALAFLARDQRGVWTLRPGGLWRDGDGRLAPRADLSAALDLALDLELPRFEITKITTGAQPYHFAWTGDGRVRGWRADPPDPAALRSLWEAVERERFCELPARVGSSRAPCGSYARMRVVGRRTVHEVRLALEAADDPRQREAIARARAVWEAVPIPHGIVR